MTDRDFRAMYAQRDDGRWVKKVLVRARRVETETRVATSEGMSVARPGDWVLMADGVGRWPVDDKTFRSHYEEA